VATTHTDNKQAPKQVTKQLTSLRIFKQALDGIGSVEKVMPRRRPVKLDIRTEMPAYMNGEMTYFEIRIYDVDSPSRFTFQFSQAKLDDMMQKMNTHYDSLKNLADYRVEQFIIGMIVAVRRRDHPEQKHRWYRAQVMEASLDKLAVQYIDFLTVTKQIPCVQATDVYYLVTEFARESPKSAFGRLHGIKPKPTGWCLKSKSKVMSLREQTMMATIKNHQNEIYAISIVMKCKDFVRIYDHMVEEKLAEPDFDELSDNPPKGQRTLI
jgi:hypothetical protein